MNKSKCFGMQGLSFTDLKTVFNKLFILIENGAFQYFISSIRFIIKQGVTNMFHMNPDLMCPAGFQYAFYKGYVAKSFQHFIVCNCFLAVITFGVGFK